MQAVAAGAEGLKLNAFGLHALNLRAGLPASARLSPRSPRVYRRREPEHTALYAVLQSELETFLAQAGKRMTRFAEHLVDEVLPLAPVRQWVLTVPYRVRYHMDCDHALRREVHRAFTRALQLSHRRRAAAREVTSQSFRKPVLPQLVRAYRSKAAIAARGLTLFYGSERNCRWHIMRSTCNAR